MCACALFCPSSPRYPAKRALYWVFHRRVDWSSGRGGGEATFWKSTGKHARLRYLCTHPCMYIRILVLIEYATDGDGKPFAGTTTVGDQWQPIFRNDIPYIYIYVYRTALLRHNSNHRLIVPYLSPVRGNPVHDIGLRTKRVNWRRFFSTLLLLSRRSKIPLALRYQQNTGQTHRRYTT